MRIKDGLHSVSTKVIHIYGPFCAILSDINLKLGSNLSYEELQVNLILVMVDFPHSFPLNRWFHRLFSAMLSDFKLKLLENFSCFKIKLDVVTWKASNTDGREKGPSRGQFILFL